MSTRGLSRAARFGGFTRASEQKPVLRSPKRKLREAAFFESRHAFPRLAARASRRSVPLSGLSGAASRGATHRSQRTFGPGVSRIFSTAQTTHMSCRTGLPVMTFVCECGQTMAHSGNPRKRRGVSRLPIAAACGGLLYLQPANGCRAPVRHGRSGCCVRLPQVGSPVRLPCGHCPEDL
jgi:hypothetical protein